MAPQAAIDDPEVLRRLRSALIQLADECQRAIEEGLRDCARFEHWLQAEELPLLGRQTRAAEQRYGEARIRYQAAKNAPRQQGPVPLEDVERDFLRAKRALAALEDRQQRLQRVLRQFPKECERPSAQARLAGRRVEDAVPRVIGRLDHMLDALQRYGGSGGPE